MTESKTPINSFYKSVPLVEPYISKPDHKQWSSWQCLSPWCNKIVSFKGATNSNLRTCLLNANNINEYTEFKYEFFI